MNSYNGSEILLYQTEDGQAKIDVKVAGETVWLTLNQMAELFQHVFDEGEIQEATVVANYATTAHIAPPIV